MPFNDPKRTTFLLTVAIFLINCEFWINDFPCRYKAPPSTARLLRNWQFSMLTMESRPVLITPPPPNALALLPRQRGKTMVSRFVYKIGVAFSSRELTFQKLNLVSSNSLLGRRERRSLLRRERSCHPALASMTKIP